MTWIGGGICFLIWVAYGWRMRSQADVMRARLAGMSRSRIVFLGSGGLLLGLLVLKAGMVGLALLGGADADGIKLWAWPFVLLLGLIFVHVQVWGAAAMLTLVLGRETPPPSQSSTPQEPS
ncbi:MAG: hypothetical protein MH204_11520 [Fimbriimonadaceae bacterium]|nr:hypothetical protein [Fimbriimonadaceae bacterium]